jgi:chemotaxis protein MotB
MGKNPWEEPDQDVLALEASLRAKSPRRWLRVLVGLVVVGTLTFIGAYYVPLFRAHDALRAEFRALSERRRVLDESLGNKQRELERVTQEKADLQAQLAERVTEEAQQKEKLEQLRTGISSQLLAYESKGLAASVVESQRLRVTLANDLVFSRHTLTIPSKGTSLLCKIAQASGDASLRVVAVTTTDEPRSALLSAKYPSKRELSAARAAAVGNRLEQECDVKGDALEIAGSVEPAKRKASGVKPPTIVLEFTLARS